MEGFIGEIRAFSGTYAPEGWNFCNGATLPINGYEALYSLIGNTYGGSEGINFALPDLRGRLPIGQGTGYGLTPYTMGERGGAETITLTASSIPSHYHAVKACTAGTATNAPSQLTLLGPMSSPDATVVGYLPVTATVPKDALLDNTTIQPTGGSQPHSNMMPCMAINYIICTANNLYPPRQ
jgi:microcystin-dependent protein